MILKYFVLLGLLFVSSINGSPRKYKYVPQAVGWMKWYPKADYMDAFISCDTEGAVLVSPLTSQIREAVKHFLRREGQPTTIMSGVRATFEDADYLSVEGVNLQKMPVEIDSSEEANLESSQSCVKWLTHEDIVQYTKCTTMLPYVCYKKRSTVTIAGCKAKVDGYIYNERSGSCYKFHEKGLKWAEAYQKCKSEKGYLAIGNSKLENKVLKEFFNKYPSTMTSGTAADRAFVGIHDRKDGESWKTVKGQTLEEAGFTGWDRGEPNNEGGIEQCVSLYRDGTYNDDSCLLSLIFICESDPDILLINKSE